MVFKGKSYLIHAKFSLMRAILIITGYFKLFKLFARLVNSNL